MDDDKTNTEIWYCNYCKIMVTNGDVMLIDKNKDADVVNGTFFWMFAYRSLKTKQKSKS